jgi:hypothetical protein
LPAVAGTVALELGWQDRTIPTEPSGRLTLNIVAMLSGSRWISHASRAASQALSAFDIYFPSDPGKGIGVSFSSEAGVYDISTGPPALLAVNGQIRHIRGASRKQRGEDGAG